MYGACITIRDFEHICHELNNLSHMQRSTGAGLVAADGLQGKPTIESLDVFRAPWVQKSKAEAAQGENYVRFTGFTAPLLVLAVT
jgi:hypothetical protein